MADQQLLNMLKKRVRTWNQWQRRNANAYPDFSHTNLEGTQLSFAQLQRVNLHGANLSHANLSATNLNGTLFRGTILENTNPSHALLQNTAFVNVDLSMVRELDTIYPLGSSMIDVDRLTRSKNLSESVLRKLKIHENLIVSLREQGKAPLEYASIFISYASEDFAFVQKLRDALQQEGVWCWFAPDALRGGDFFKVRID